MIVDDIWWIKRGINFEIIRNWQKWKKIERTKGRRVGVTKISQDLRKGRSNDFWRNVGNSVWRHNHAFFSSLGLFWWCLVTSARFIDSVKYGNMKMEGTMQFVDGPICHQQLHWHVKKAIRDAFTALTAAALEVAFAFDASVTFDRHREASSTSTEDDQRVGILFICPGILLWPWTVALLNTFCILAPLIPLPVN